MTATAIPLATTRKDAILQIAEQMKATECKSYSLSYIGNRIKRENGKWIMESKRFRYEVTDDAEDATEDANVK